MLAILTIPAAAAPCDKPEIAQPAEVSQNTAKTAPVADPIGLSRIVEIDTGTGALFGDITKFQREESFLGPKEVLLTFDDGPLPWITQSILDTLDRHCTKATFFSVGRMALAYPQHVKDIMARGHTLGTHTWSHPMNIGRLGFEQGKDQIERGFAAVALAAGQPIAPFFRFPGLNDSDPLLAHMQTRAIASFTVDVVSNDSYIADAGRLTQRVIQQTEKRNGGILLFHDIKASTAKALPGILKELQARGYSVVHMRAKAPVVPLAKYEAELSPILAKTMAQLSAQSSAKGGVVHQMRPFYGSASLLQPQDVNMVSNGSPGDAAIAPPEAGPPVASTDLVPVTALAPPARSRVATTAPSETRRAGKRNKISDDAANTSISFMETETKPLPRAKVRTQRQPAKKNPAKMETNKGSSPLFFPF